MSLATAELEARRVLNVDLLPARLGNGTGTVYDLTTPGNYFLRKLEADGRLSQPFSLPVNPLASIPPVDGLPVSIGYDLKGIQVIWQADATAMLSANTNPYILNPLDTAVYGKTSQTTLSTLFYQRHGDTTNFPFTIVVFKAPVIINGVADLFAGSSINVTSFVPSTGFKRYVCVFLRTDMTLEVFGSTPINMGDPLTVARDVQDCIDQSSTDSVIICAWELDAGDVGLSASPAKNVDMRQIVNTTSGGGSGSLTVSDGSTTVTDVSDITFNGAQFTVTDLGGGAVEVDATGTGTSPSVILDYIEASDLFNNTAVTTSTWTDFIANQSFTIDSGISYITVSVMGSAVLGTDPSSIGVRIVIDSAGTPVNRVIGGNYVPGNFINIFGGVNTIQVTGLSAGSHTIKVQFFCDGVGTHIYCRPSSKPDIESFAILIMEYP